MAGVDERGVDGRVVRVQGHVARVDEARHAAVLSGTTIVSHAVATQRIDLAHPARCCRRRTTRRACGRRGSREPTMPATIRGDRCASGSKSGSRAELLISTLTPIAVARVERLGEGRDVGRAGPPTQRRRRPRARRGDGRRGGRELHRRRCAGRRARPCRPPARGRAGTPPRCSRGTPRGGAAVGDHGRHRVTIGVHRAT